jgi:hypothetical protein
MHTSAKLLKATRIVGSACAMLLAANLTAFAETVNTRYIDDSENADYSGLGPDGGDIIIPMILYKGPALPEITTPFNVTFTLSPVTLYYADENTPSPSWSQTPTGEPFPSAAFPTGLFNAIPPKNSVIPPLDIDGINIFDDSGAWFAKAIDQDIVEWSGEFTITTYANEVPEAPEGFELTLNSIGWGVTHLMAGDQSTSAFGYAIFTVFDTQYTEFGAITRFRFAAISDGDNAPEDLGHHAIWTAAADLEYSPVPEPSTIGLVLAAGGALALRQRRRARA